MARPKINVFSLSFLDLLSCALGAVILLMVIFTIMMDNNQKHRRSLIFSTVVYIQTPENKQIKEQKVTFLLELLTKDNDFDILKYFQIVLYDPEGVEHIPDPTRLGNNKKKILISYTTERPTFGLWQVLLKARQNLDIDETQNKKTFEVTEEVLPILNLYERLFKNPRSPEYSVVLANMSQDLKKFGNADREQQRLLMPQILMRSRKLFDPQTENRGVIKDFLEIFKVADIYDANVAAQQLCNSMIRLNQKRNWKIDVELITLLAKAYDYSYYFSDWRTRKYRFIIGCALTERLWQLRKELYKTNDIKSNRFIDIEITLANYIESSAIRHQATKRLLGWGLSQTTEINKTVYVAFGFYPKEYSLIFSADTENVSLSCNKIFDKNIVLSQENPVKILKKIQSEFDSKSYQSNFITEDSSGMWLIPILTSLRTTKFKVLDTQKILPVTNLYEENQREILKKQRMQAILQVADDTKVSGLIAFHLIKYFEDQNEQEKIEKITDLIEKDLERKQKTIQAIATNLPELFFKVRDAIIKQHELSLKLDPIYIHWGSTIRQRTKTIPKTHLESPRAVLKFDLYPEDIKIKDYDGEENNSDSEGE